VKASPESGAFERGRSGGQQVRTPLIRKVAAVLPLSVQENRGKEGRGERPKLRGPEAGRRIVRRHPPSDKCSAVGAGGVQGAKGGRRGPHGHVSSAGRCQEGSIGLEGVVSRRPTPPERRGRASFSTTGTNCMSAGGGCSTRSRAA
jgi:hypothetical protein